MDVESSALAALTLGFLLGLKHATDADHVVAVSTIVSEYRSAWRGIWVGASWGIGHSTPLIALGIVILLFKQAVLEHYVAVAPIFEVGVGAMLVLLGVQVFWNLKRGLVHLHDHRHDGGPHVHIHATHDPSEDSTVETSHGFFHPGRPFFRVKSYTVGFVHGLAGSAAVMLLLLPQVPSLWVGIGYLVLFGLGTVLSMAVVTVILGVPFALSGRTEGLKHAVSGVAGAASLLLGLALISDIALGTALTPF